MVHIVPEIVEKVAETATLAGGKELAELGLRDAARRIEAFDRVLGEDFKIEGRAMAIQCDRDVQRYSISLEPKSRPILPKRVHVRGGTITDASIIQVRGLSEPDDAIRLEEDGFSINLKSLTPGELYILDVDYSIEDERLLRALVETLPPRDAPFRSEDDTRTYEMSAQLKHVDVLRHNYYSVKLSEVPLTVNVAVHQDVKTAVPGIMVAQLENLLKMSEPRGLSDMMKLARAQYGLQRHKHGTKGLEKLKDLRELFTPATFEKYVVVENDFCFAECSQGRDYYEKLPFPSWPRDMEVVSTTSLSLDHPAAAGKLVYARRKFVDEIARALSKSG